MNHSLIIFKCKAVWQSNCRKKISFYRDDKRNLGGLSLRYPSDWEGIPVECISPDQIFESNKITKECILKMDCEGCEFDVLFNMSKKYLKLVKCIGMEYHSLLGPKRLFENKMELKKYFEDSGFNVVQTSEPIDEVLGTFFCFNKSTKH
jgi:hypothetical protein